VSRFYFEASNEARHVIRVVNHENHVYVGGLREHVAHLHRIEDLGACKAALDYRDAQWVAEQKQTFLDAECAK
jgi:hypothetical protein